MAAESGSPLACASDQLSQELPLLHPKASDNCVGALHSSTDWLPGICVYRRLAQISCFDLDIFCHIDLLPSGSLCRNSCLLTAQQHTALNAILYYLLCSGRTADQAMSFCRGREVRAGEFKYFSQDQQVSRVEMQTNDLVQHQRLALFARKGLINLSAVRVTVRGKGSIVLSGTQRRIMLVFRAT